MKALKWWTFVILFTLSLSFSTESTNDYSTDETTTYETTTDIDSTYYETVTYETIPDEDSTDKTVSYKKNIDKDLTPFDYDSKVKELTTFDYDSNVKVLTPFDYDSNVKKLTPFDYDAIVKDLHREITSKSRFDYDSKLEDSVTESSAEYVSGFKDPIHEKTFESSAIKNLLYPPGDRNCDPHEHFEYCTGHCQRNCSNWKKALVCPDVCVPGCICDWGWTRGPEGNCILVSECPPQEDEEPIKINVKYECKQNEHFTACGRPKECQKDCSNYNDEIPCVSYCEPGCVCDEGFVRGPYGKCIPTTLCQNPLMRSLYLSYQKLPKLCRSNQHFSACDGFPMCQRSCSNYNESIICPLVCVPGCACDEGYVIGPSGECVILEQCDFERISHSTEESKQLQTPSEKENESSENTQDEFSNTPSTTPSDVDEEDFCPPNEIFSPCLAHCQKNCTNWSDPTVPCLKICVPGCICDHGLVRGPYGSCIQPRKCPSTQSLQNEIFSPSYTLHYCAENEHLDNCHSHCWVNCSNWDKEVPCLDICIPGCVCDQGYVRGPWGKCILIEKCLSVRQKSRKIIKKKNPCPDGEKNSNLRSIPGSSQYCVSTVNDSLEFCPPTFLRGCVCEKGQIRGEDSRCIDRRLLPDANEIPFLHDNMRKIAHQESDSNTEATEVSINDRELDESSTIDPTTITSVTMITAETSTKKKFIRLDTKYKWCPDMEVCNIGCIELGYKIGACVLTDWYRCECFT